MVVPTSTCENREAQSITSNQTVITALGVTQDSCTGEGGCPMCVVLMNNKRTHLAHPPIKQADLSAGQCTITMRFSIREFIKLNS